MSRKHRKMCSVFALVLAFFVLFLFSACTGEAKQEGYPLTYEQEVEHWAATYGLDPYLVYAVIRTESGFDPAAESTAGARGLMQMTEDTFNWVKSKIAPQEALTFEDLYDPETSIRFGCYFLSYCMEKYEADISTAAAAYHSGMGTVDSLLEDEKYTSDGVRLEHFPYNQMAHYVQKVNDSYNTYRELYAASPSGGSSEVL